MKTKEIGYWYNDNEHEKHYPVPVANSANGYQIIEMSNNLVRFIIDKKTSIQHCKGSSICRICNSANGSGEHVGIVNDVKIIIPEGTLHYVAEHRVLIPDLLKLYK